jgi:hypothetical protein
MTRKINRKWTMLSIIVNGNDSREIVQFYHPKRKKGSKFTEFHGITRSSAERLGRLIHRWYVELIGSFIHASSQPYRHGRASLSADYKRLDERKFCANDGRNIFMADPEPENEAPF